MSALPISISSRYPMHIEVDANMFGEIFAELDSAEQVAVFRAMVDHMKPHQTQWDHISIELELPENMAVRRTLRDVLFPTGEVVEMTDTRAWGATAREIGTGYDMHVTGPTKADVDLQLFGQAYSAAAWSVRYYRIEAQP